MLKLVFHLFFTFFNIFDYFSLFFAKSFIGQMSIETKKNGTMGARHIPIPIKDDSMQVDSSLCQTLHRYNFCIYCNYHKETSNKTSNIPYCCEQQNLKDISGQVTCINCGQVVYEDFKTEYIDFHTNLYKIYKKTVYNRKYHLSHTLDKIILQCKVKISCSNSFKIHKIFVEINTILPQINGQRKRIISLKYLLHKILQLMKIDSSTIDLTKFKKTLKLYDLYWNNIMGIIGPKIIHIINQT